MRRILGRETLALIVIGYALLGLGLGWFVGVEFILRWSSDLPAIVPSTCISFLLIGVALYLLPEKELSQIMILLLGLGWAALLPTGSLILTVFMPQWSMNDILGFSVDDPDRMSTITSVLLLVAIGLVVASISDKCIVSQSVRLISLGGIALSTGLFVFNVLAVGLAGSTDPLAGLSLPTLFLFILVFCGLSFAGDEQSGAAA